MANEETRRTIIRAATTEALLMQDSSKIGPGSRATLLCHEVGFDSVMILLEPAARGIKPELSEVNHSDLEILYFVTEAEDDQVEFELDGRLQRISCGAEVLVPPQQAYTLRNCSRTHNARLVAVVPMAVPGT